jgi:hypothetical protein
MQHADSTATPPPCLHAQAAPAIWFKRCTCIQWHAGCSTGVQVHPGAWLVHRPHEDTKVRKMVAREASDVNKLSVKLPKNALYYKVWHACCSHVPFVNQDLWPVDWSCRVYMRCCQTVLLLTVCLPWYLLRGWCMAGDDSVWRSKESHDQGRIQPEAGRPHGHMLQQAVMVTAPQAAERVACGPFNLHLI